MIPSKHDPQQIDGFAPRDAAPDADARAPEGTRAGSATPSRSRSFGFLEREAERWTVFLTTYPDARAGWRGYFSFRAAGAEEAEESLRTADLFVEGSEAEVDARARGLGRPLLLALLESALRTREQRRQASPDVRGWFRDFLANQGAGLTPDIGQAPEPSLSHLRSLYASYRMDQVAHLIALVEPDHFRLLVERTLDGREIDFRARDRLQLAMMVVQEIERRLPLPPFEIWAEDYLAHREEYHLYSHELHRERILP